MWEKCEETKGRMPESEGKTKDDGRDQQRAGHNLPAKAETQSLQTALRWSQHSSNGGEESKSPRIEHEEHEEHERTRHWRQRRHGQVWQVYAVCIRF